MSKTHPIKTLGLTYEEIAEAVRKANRTKTPSGTQIALVAGGHRRCGIELAAKIHKAFPSLSREEIIYHNR